MKSSFGVSKQYVSDGTLPVLLVISNHIVFNFGKFGSTMWPLLVAGLPSDQGCGD